MGSGSLVYAGVSVVLRLGVSFSVVRDARGASPDRGRRSDEPRELDGRCLRAARGAFEVSGRDVARPGDAPRGVSTLGGGEVSLVEAFTTFRSDVNQDSRIPSLSTYLAPPYE